MKAELRQEHRWLERLVGEWTVEMESAAGPGQPAAKHTGTESVRTLAGAWALCEGQSESPDGGPATTIMTLGYDPARQRYVGTFVGAMMTHLWIYDGELDSTGRALTLDTEGPSFTAEGRMARYRDVIAFESDDQRTLTSYMLGDDGAWQVFMTATYQRVR
jgi:hypothetical protein